MKGLLVSFLILFCFPLICFTYEDNISILSANDIRTKTKAHYMDDADVRRVVVPQVIKFNETLNRIINNDPFYASVSNLIFTLVFKDEDDDKIDYYVKVFQHILQDKDFSTDRLGSNRRNESIGEIYVRIEINWNNNNEMDEKLKIMISLFLWIVFLFGALLFCLK
jgi:hypothetical protein